MAGAAEARKATQMRYDQYRQWGMRRSWWLAPEAGAERRERDYRLRRQLRLGLRVEADPIPCWEFCRLTGHTGHERQLCPHLGSAAVIYDSA